MSMKLDRYVSESRSLSKVDILAESIGQNLIIPQEGHYSRRKRHSVSPAIKQSVKIQQPENQQQQIIEEINKLNRIIRFKSQLIKKKFDLDKLDEQRPVIKQPQTSKQIYLRYESNFNPKSFQELVSSIRKQTDNLQFLSCCFPQILQSLDIERNGGRRKLNIEKQIKYKSNEVKQDYISNQREHTKSEATLPKTNQKRIVCQLIKHWQDLLQSIIMQQNGSNVFLYIMANNYPLFIGYISYSLGTDKIGKGEPGINLDRVFIIQSFRISSQQQLICNLFKTLIRSLSEGQPTKPLKAYWSIKHNLLNKAQKWGWKMAAFQRKRYILVLSQ